MQIFVKYGTSFAFDVELSDFVADLKHELELKLSIPAVVQRLVFESKRLQDDVRLGDYGITSGCTLACEVAPPVILTFNVRMSGSLALQDGSIVEVRATLMQSLEFHKIELASQWAAPPHCLKFKINGIIVPDEALVTRSLHQETIDLVLDDELLWVERRIPDIVADATNKSGSLKRALTQVTSERDEAVCARFKAARLLLSRLPHCSRYTTYQIKSVDASHLIYSYLEQGLRDSLQGHRGCLRDPSICPPPLLHVEKIEEVFNPRLLEKYMLELQQMNGLHRFGCSQNICMLGHAKLEPTFDSDLNEVLLYHGANTKDVDLISEAGFDPRRGGQSAGRLFGFGTYFAEAFSKADLYSGPTPFKRDTGKLCVLVARVALGEALASHVPLQDLRMPPERPNMRHPYDSVWAPKRSEGGCVDHREYIIYKDSQAIPVYRIWYRHDTDCECARCVNPGVAVPPIASLAAPKPAPPLAPPALPAAPMRLFGKAAAVMPPKASVSGAKVASKVKAQPSVKAKARGRKS